MGKTLDALGDRMKGYERPEAGRCLMPLLPAVVRLDGRGFSRWTRGLQRPYDVRLQSLMVDLTAALVEETNARIGYTQSDEISLVLYAPDPKSQLYFDGRIQKITSCLAGYAAAWFNRDVPGRIPEKAAGPLATFDCRVWNVPSIDEATNAVLWRELDATKNAVQMAAHHYYSHAELDNKHTGEMQEMLWRKGVNFNDYPAAFKRGSYVRRVTRTGRFTAEEIAALPPMHDAARNPDAEFERSTVERVEFPPLSKVPNRVAVLFDGAAPA